MKKPTIIRKKNISIIDRDSYEPAYLQIVSIIRSEIASGIFRPGSKLPSESEIIEKHHVSPMTVRRAINLLIDSGVVNTVQGKGTFVKPMEMTAFTFRLDALIDIFQDKKRTAIKFLGVKIKPADEYIASRLSIKTGDKTIFIKRLIYRDNEPIILHKEHIVYYPYRPIVESEMDVTSLHGLFSGKGQTEFKKGEFAMEAAVLNEDESRLLEIPLLSSAFRLEHTFYDFDDKIAAWGEFLCRGDRLRFTTKVGIWD